MDPETFRSDPNYIELQRLYAAADKVKRAAFVCYFPHQAVFRTGNYAMTPSLNFGNTGTLSKADTTVKTFAGEGEYILGSTSHAKSCMARELAFAFFNGLSQIGCQMPGMSAQALLAHVGYEDPSNSQQLLPVVPHQYDVLNPTQSVFVERWRSYLSYYYRLRKSLLLNINQKEFFSHQEDLLKRLKRVAQSSEHQAKRPSDLRQGVSIQHDAVSTQGPTMSPGDQSHSTPSHTKGKEKSKNMVSSSTAVNALDEARGLTSRLICGGASAEEDVMSNMSNVPAQRKRAASPENWSSNEDVENNQQSKKQKTAQQNRGAVGPVCVRKTNYGSIN